MCLDQYSIYFRSNIAFIRYLNFKEISMTNCKVNIRESTLPQREREREREIIYQNKEGLEI